MHINIHKNNRRLLLRALLITLSMPLLLASFPLASAGETDTGTQKNQQQKLQTLLDKIGESQEQRDQQKYTLDKLDQQMECNWELIRGYDACEEIHKKNLEEHLNCKQIVQKNAVECLSRTKSQ